MEASRTANQIDSIHSTNRRISTKYLNISVEYPNISKRNLTKNENGYMILSIQEPGDKRIRISEYFLP
jgi:hypothetical protein